MKKHSYSEVLTFLCFSSKNHRYETEQEKAKCGLNLYLEEPAEIHLLTIETKDPSKEETGKKAVMRLENN